MTKQSLQRASFVIVGGTGSFGCTMARHLLSSNEKRINILSRDESKQDTMRRIFNDERMRFFIGRPDELPGGGTRDNFSLTAVVTDAKAASWDPLEFLSYLGQRNIEARPLWKPMHMQPVHAATAVYANGVSERLFASSVSLPSDSALTEQQVEVVEKETCSFIASKELL